MKAFFISTSIPYVNAEPHIGFLLEALEADVISRFRRSLGSEVYFLTGTDDNALKNVQSAEKSGMKTQEFVDLNAKKFIELMEKFDISNNDFIRTSKDERHKLGAQKLWNACSADIYKKKYEGLYCVGCESFKTQKELKDDFCELHPGKPLQKVSEENYFFKLSNYQEKLLSLIESGKLRIIPDEKKNEITQFIKMGLEDFSISRSSIRAKNWGIKVPGSEDQIMYVWFDALSNYINALGYASDDLNFERFWKNGYKIHIVGKDINRFHSVYWPAMLLSAGIELPDTVFVHGFINDENGQKMSKTLGNYVNPFDLLNKYGKDPIRYFFLKEGAHYSDSNFSIKLFEEKYNSDLANGLGNFAARVSTLIEKNGQIAFDKFNQKNLDIELHAFLDKTILEMADYLLNFKIAEAINSLWGLISYGDAYVNNNKPWSKDLTQERREFLLGNLGFMLYEISRALDVFIPETASKIRDSLKFDGKNIFSKKIENLFPKINS
ncbi:MAG: methionine--tRNA ligase [Candidatus Pacebacteria bacterium]|nr:methionine--tRNA ligase [Candidatus Paceibacterota bacterium]